MGSIATGTERLSAAHVDVSQLIRIVDATDGRRFEIYTVEGGRGRVEIDGAVAWL